MDSLIIKDENITEKVTENSTHGQLKINKNQAEETSDRTTTSLRFRPHLQIYR